MAFNSLNRVKGILMVNPMLFLFIFMHTTFAIFLGRLFALAPDESGYIYTFNNVYTLPIGTSAQSASGWIAAPTVFLWVAYLPAKILNLIGVPDYLAIRMLSILLTVVTIYLLLEIQKRSAITKKISQKAIFLVFLIPSVFLWTTVGLRESFIIAEIAVFLAGLNFLFTGSSRRGMLLLVCGSYGLISTKNYLWACLMVALILSVILFLVRGISKRQIMKLIVAGFVLPVALFAGTTSAYALDYLLHSDISETGARSGDSISQVVVEVPGSGSGSGTETETETETETVKKVITFHGDSTLIALHFYLIDNPNALFSKIFRAIHLDKKIQSIWNEKVALGLVSKDKQVGTDTSSLNGHILEPAKITEPVSLLWASFVFLCGPFPFIGDPGIAVGIASLESLLWWTFYALVIFQFIRFRKINFMGDPQILFTLIFLAGEIAFSALVEVNLGTSFRHRSILLVPLVFLFVRLTQRAKEQKDFELGII